ncbi:SMP-30/gluconolactonase/LRE family protein [Tessaracoccus palaemonis]|uniref:SMP-30/gluconolactonase/LRE family protein n=2 Tax=Tessaracoccus palaemonis TaxID=2829499 RepID=A0ABX8SIH6_9ACTN|nr:SMP-30/gluconolactonase/LRE family protein [Tessaracoccus palaemonis]QXT61783.1 SMP-30/gluconolactonase/LRE family protein [Tessaracoccus palaemonis]
MRIRSFAGLELVDAEPCLLGEGPTWDPVTGKLRWVDIRRGLLLEAAVDDSGVGRAREVLRVEGTLGAAVPAVGGGLLLATARHLAHVDGSGMVLGAVELISRGAGRRLNDGACDPAGRYLVGSLALGDITGEEELWRLEHDGSVTQLASGISLSNGLAWSPDGRVMYHVDTLAHQITARGYDVASGAVGEPSMWLDCAADFPDGLTVDADGSVWIAFWGAGEVRCYSPEGELQSVQGTGASLTTSCEFVGPGLDQLAITTAAADGDEPSDPGDSPHAGRVVIAHPGARGLPSTPWRPTPMADADPGLSIL